MQAEFSCIWTLDSTYSFKLCTLFLQTLRLFLCLLHITCHHKTSLFKGY